MKKQVAITVATTVTNIALQNTHLIKDTKKRKQAKTGLTVLSLILNSLAASQPTKKRGTNEN